MAAIKSIIVYSDGSALVSYENGDVASARAHQVTTPEQRDQKSNADVACEALREIAGAGNPADRIAAAQVLLTFERG